MIGIQLDLKSNHRGQTFPTLKYSKFDEQNTQWLFFILDFKVKDISLSHHCRQTKLYDKSYSLIFHVQKPPDMRTHADTDRENCSIYVCVFVQMMNIQSPSPFFLLESAWSPLPLKSSSQT